MTNIDHVLGLTRQALDEFDSVPLAASLRRALRIARLRGDITYAHMFQLDLRPHGGSTVWRRTEAYELLKSGISALSMSISGGRRSARSGSRNAPHPRFISFFGTRLMTIL